MPIYTPDDPAFDALAKPFHWFENVLAVEYGERDADEPLPDALNWVRLLPDALQLSLAEAECSLLYENPDTGYVAALWDVTGEDDLPWATFLVDDYGPRLLTEYSLLTEDAEPAALDALLKRAAEQIPDRLLSAEFDRSGTPLTIPEWLTTPPAEE